MTDRHISTRAAEAVADAALARRGQVRIGVLADTHGLLRDEALDAMRGADVILHAGDVGKYSIIERLSELAPIVAVRGNIDRAGPEAELPERVILTLAGQRILLLHDLKTLEPDAAADYAVVVAGHSHKPRCDLTGTTLLFSPGAAGQRRFKLPIAVGILKLTPTGAHGEIITLLT